jgi:hypothetical protein
MLFLSSEKGNLLKKQQQWHFIVQCLHILFFFTSFPFPFLLFIFINNKLIEIAI